VLGLADPNNPKDPEASVMAVLKDLRDHSKLNRTTPKAISALVSTGSHPPPNLATR
jgi:hypothetical protein